MSTKTEQQPQSADTLKWGVVVILLATAVIGNSYFGDLAAYIRFFGVIVVVGLAALVAAQTEKGKNTITFARESRTEIKKVVWPTRQETLQTTMIVGVVTLIMSLILWGLDGIMVRLVAFITGVRF